MASYTVFSEEALLAEFGKRIAGYRLNNNWTQADLAHKAGVSKSTVEHIEKGQSVQISNLLKILGAFDLQNQFLEIIPRQTPSPMELLRQSQMQQANQRKRASKPRGKQGQASQYNDLNEFTATSIAAEPKVPWVWEEDK